MPRPPRPRSKPSAGDSWPACCPLPLTPSPQEPSKRVVEARAGSCLLSLPPTSSSLGSLDPANPRPQLKTAPFDSRFPTTNQAKHCFTRYNEFHKRVAVEGGGARGWPPPTFAAAPSHTRAARRCAKEKAPEDASCRQFQRWYRSVCPTDWARPPHTRLAAARPARGSRPRPADDEVGRGAGERQLRGALLSRLGCMRSQSHHLSRRPAAASPRALRACRAAGGWPGRRACNKTPAPPPLRRS